MTMREDEAEKNVGCDLESACYARSMGSADSPFPLEPARVTTRRAVKLAMMGSGMAIWAALHRESCGIARLEVGSESRVLPLRIRPVWTYHRKSSVQALMFPSPDNRST